MAQIETSTGPPVSLSLGAENGTKRKEQSGSRSAQFSASWRCSGSLSNVAPILRTSIQSLPDRLIHPCQRGHLYFVKKGTFLFWVDRST